MSGSHYIEPQWLLPTQKNDNNISNFSLNFDGLDDYIDCGNPSKLQILSDISVSCWFKTSSSATMMLISKRNNALNLYGYQLYISGNVLRFLITLNGIVTYTAIGTTIINDGQWHNVIGKIEQNTKLSIVLDGSTEATASIGAETYIDSASPLQLGFQLVGATSYYFEGLMDEVAIWDGLISSSLVYGGGKPPDLTSLNPLSYWKIADESRFASQWLVPNFMDNRFSQFSFAFDGIGDTITTGVDCSSATHPSITVSCWLRYPVEPPYHFGIYYATGVQSANGVYQGLGLMNGGSIANKANGSWTTGTNLRDNMWHNVIWVCEYNTPSPANMTMNVYLDGNPTPDISTIDTSGGELIGDLFIGSYDGSTRYFDGNIDSVAVWYSALTTGDVNSIFNGGIPSDLSSLVPDAWWRLGEFAHFTGGIWEIPDQSGHPHQTGNSVNMTTDNLKGEAPDYIGGGISNAMDIFDREGTAPQSNFNGVTYNMELKSIVNDVP